MINECLECHTNLKQHRNMRTALEQIHEVLFPLGTGERSFDEIVKEVQTKNDKIAELEQQRARLLRALEQIESAAGYMPDLKPSPEELARKIAGLRSALDPHSIKHKAVMSKGDPDAFEAEMVPWGTRMTRDERKKKKAQLKKLKARWSREEDVRMNLEDRLWEAEEREGKLLVDIEFLEAELAPKRPPEPYRGALVDPYDYRDYPAPLLPTDEPLS